MPLPTWLCGSTPQGEMTAIELRLLDSSWVFKLSSWCGAGERFPEGSMCNMYV